MCLKIIKLLSSYCLCIYSAFAFLLKFFSCAGIIQTFQLMHADTPPWCNCYVMMQVKLWGCENVLIVIKSHSETNRPFLSGWTSDPAAGCMHTHCQFQLNLIPHPDKQIIAIMALSPRSSAVNSQHHKSASASRCCSQTNKRGSCSVLGNILFTTLQLKYC